MSLDREMLEEVDHFKYCLWGHRLAGRVEWKLVTMRERGASKTC